MLREYLIFTGALLLLGCQGSIAARYIGCYGQIHRNELFFPFESYLGSKMTKDKCLELCTYFEYKFAGLKTTQCACGNLYPPHESLKPQNDCDSPCEGDRSEEVCGNSTTSVYDLYGSEASENVLPFVGCFKELGNSLLISTTMKRQDCFLNCQSKGFKFAGLRGTFCFCSNAASGRNKDGGGKSPNYCVPYQLKVFFTVPGYQKYLGCYKMMDKDWKREALTGNKTCPNLCRHKGLRYAATENEAQCYCSNDRPSYKLMTSETNCQKICNESVFEFCSDPGYLRVSDLVGDREYEALRGECLREKEKEKIMEGIEILHPDNTPEKCAGLCLSYGYKLAGLKQGIFCRCGNEKREAKRGECLTRCPGDAELTCGGISSIQIYHVEE